MTDVHHQPGACTLLPAEARSQDAEATRLSTPLGDALGGAMRVSARFFDYVLPIAAIRVYRLIPARWRGPLFGGPSASCAAIQRIKAQGGGGWEVIRADSDKHPPRPSGLGK